MASTINSNNINILYPIAGQDNDTQGFRDNFRNIKNNLSTAAQEITALQASLAKTPLIAIDGITQADYITGNIAIPTTASDSGVRGQMAFDENYLYICIASDTWVRANVSTW